jgi:hypothetical protein
MYFRIVGNYQRSSEYGTYFFQNMALKNMAICNMALILGKYDIYFFKTCQNKAFYGIFPNSSKIWQNSMAPWQCHIAMANTPTISNSVNLNFLGNGGVASG